ncbi:phosphate system positive regulatory protein pho81 [Lecanora helva]
MKPPRQEIRQTPTKTAARHSGLIKQLSATPTLLAQNATETFDPQALLQANKATFFFRLERELEKVNVFYLQKEAELKLRLKTLLDKKRLMQVRTATASKVSASFINLEEGFQQFGDDLNKLQQFIELNATAFSKILKKWDKTSKSRTKELYLSRAVEVQPCFNRDVISDLSDQATTSLLELGAWAEGEKVQYDSSRPPEHTVTGQTIGTDNSDTDAQIIQASIAGNLAILREWLSRLRGSPDARDRFTRTFLAAIPEAPEDALGVLLNSGLVDLQAQDEINERNCLHEAAISGRKLVLDMALQSDVEAARVDVHGRTPLHYACMHGHVSMVTTLLEEKPTITDTLDHNNFTPLIHAIVNDKISCAEQLLIRGARIDPEDESDHVPLNLACQYGSIAIAKCLLERQAKILPDAEGLFPQHLVARTGQSPDMLLMLELYGADLDQRDKLYQWTPLLHAASEGRVDCIRTLLERGVDAQILDEKSLSAMYYAAWEGNLECMKLLGSRNTQAIELPRTAKHSLISPATTKAVSVPLDADGIPDLSLPPPIIPLRRYGHNFLDNKTFVQFSFEAMGSDPVVFYHDSKYPAARLTISSKSSDVIPRNIMLPIQEESKIISFQIDSLDAFTVDLDIFPTFGSKVIAKSVALPNIFTAITNSSGQCCLPLFDPRLRAIGQLSFAFQVIKPFHGSPLDITHFATYWRATSQLDSHPSALITGSSLSGDYVQIFVQVTSDGVPVLYPRWTVNHHGIDVPISRMTCEQYFSIGSQQNTGNRMMENLSKRTTTDIAEIHRTLAETFISLGDVLALLPTNIHLEIQVLFPTVMQERGFGLRPSPNINDFADAILKEVFDHARTTKEQNPDFMRSIVFASYNPDICTALNWKQPNYPVLLCNDLGAKRDVTGAYNRRHGGTVSSNGHHSMSIKESVRIAQSNNFMGLICGSRLLDMVPSLIESIKVAGLVLVTDTSEDPPPSGTPSTTRSYRMPEGTDGIFKGNGVLRFNEMIDM